MEPALADLCHDASRVCATFNLGAAGRLRHASIAPLAGSACDRPEKTAVWIGIHRGYRRGTHRACDDTASRDEVPTGAHAAHNRRCSLRQPFPVAGRYTDSIIQPLTEDRREHRYFER